MDKPHRIAIVLGLLSPMLSLVALGFASLSLATSQEAVRLNAQAVKMGQRAYVSVKSGKLLVRGLDYIPASEVTPDKPVFAVGSLNAEFQLANDGNTPAELTRLQFDIETPERWELLNLLHPRVRGNGTLSEVHEGLGRIGPKSIASRKYGWQVQLPAELTGYLLGERLIEKTEGRC